MSRHRGQKKMKKENLGKLNVLGRRGGGSTQPWTQKDWSSNPHTIFCGQVITHKLPPLSKSDFFIVAMSTFHGRMKIIDTVCSHSTLQIVHNINCSYYRYNCTIETKETEFQGVSNASEKSRKIKTEMRQKHHLRPWQEQFSGRREGRSQTAVGWVVSHED